MLPFNLVATFLWMWVSLSSAQVTTTPPPLTVFILTPSTYNVVKDVTQNVSLECAFNKNLAPSQTSLSEITRIRIAKADDNDNWNIVAELREYEVGVHLYDNIVGIGQINRDIQASFLRITWPTATATTFGRYRCDIPGFDNNFDLTIERSNVVVLASSSITNDDILNLLLAEQTQLQHDLDTEIKMIDERLWSLNQSICDCQTMDNMLITLNHSLGENSQSIDEQYNSLGQQVSALNQSVEYLFRSQPWPEGNYSLLEPITGCPRNTEWKKGYHKLNTESDGAPSRNEVSSPSNLPAGTLTSEGRNNFVVLNFCTKLAAISAMSWPAGSYCINRVGDSCPPGFSRGWLQMDLENYAYSAHNSLGGYTPDASISESLNDYYPWYCCRSDGPAYNPIFLPTADPFYLYRFKGACQAVKNMDARNEYIVIDTEDSNNGDRYFDSNHPDGSLNPIRQELCYYTPK